jgi:hypothetical protein
VLSACLLYLKKKKEEEKKVALGASKVAQVVA